MLKSVLFWCCGAFLLMQTSHLQAATHPFGWDDMFAMVRLGDATPSPDGRWVLFSRTSYDLEKNKGNTDLSLMAIGGGAERRLTVNAAVDTNGRWLPDGGSILFLSSRSGSFQVWKLSMAGGEAQQLTHLPVGIDGFEIAPDGSKLLFWANVFVDCADLACTAARLAEKKSNPVKARVYERLFFRHWDTWNDGRRSHLFVMDLAQGKVRDLMKGMDQDTPTKPWGGADEISWSPDGASVVFAARVSKGEAWHTNSDLYLARVGGGKAPKCLTGGNPAWDTAPVYSPDGKTLAYLAMERPGYESDRQQIVLLTLATGKRRLVAKDWDRSPGQLLWSADGQTLYLTANEHGHRKLFSVDVQSGKVSTLVAEGSVSGVKRTRTGTLIYLRDRMTSPREIFEVHPGTRAIRQISQVNGETLRSVRMSQPEEFWFEHDGRKVHGWILKPVNFRKGRKVPLAFMIHGGPQGSWLDSFHYRWNPQFYAGAGYAVVGIDFRGSTGYGQSFTDAIRGDWGPGPYSDLMAGLQHVLSKYKYIDAKKMCALGASYGGFMINWILGEKNPFQCLVNHDGLFDTVSSYFTTEELYFHEWEMKGTPWEVPQIYEQNSPRARVAKWKTPTLVVHGASDFRVVETEAFATFNALQRRGVPSKLLYFPDENHWVLKPQNSQLWHQTVLSWLDRWTHTRRGK